MFGETVSLTLFVHTFTLVTLASAMLHPTRATGGFTGHFDEQGHVMFGEIASTINEAIDREFPEDSGGWGVA